MSRIPLQPDVPRAIIAVMELRGARAPLTGAPGGTGKGRHTIECRAIEPAANVGGPKRFIATLP